MAALSVTIQSLQDVAAGKPIAADVDVDNMRHATAITVGILEAGTVSGATSLMFILQDAHGKAVVGECTANQFEMLVGAFRGAVGRFGK
ncbi:hypothetical protein [Hymenobacter sp. PAMC 26628]|uniref:hypothetical protein n=1 Tax=Hymenobacter sp. PAMC 26628 TaxID=1484118 RepID=UPI00076FF21A|nr:hypothetical protein [Hymenobacter sp. PAMC 26628]AMJ65019.1 hypothetical protein AXW84_05960 [Hymenobacter sp. PAMC 26628]